jgi:hypothetical protein
MSPRKIGSVGSLLTGRFTTVPSAGSRRCNSLPSDPISRAGKTSIIVVRADQSGKSRDRPQHSFAPDHTDLDIRSIERYIRQIARTKSERWISCIQARLVCFTARMPTACGRPNSICGRIFSGPIDQRFLTWPWHAECFSSGPHRADPTGTPKSQGGWLKNNLFREYALMALA